MTILTVLILSSGSLWAQPIDFSSMAKEENEELSSLLTETETLWEGEAEDLQFETGVLNDELLVVSATNTRLHVSLGSQFDPLEGDYSQRIPGTVLLLDLHSLPNRSDRALATVTFLTGERLKTDVLVIRQSSGTPQVTRFHQSNWKMIRPVGDRMMTQTFDPHELWREKIHFLRTTESGYSRGEPVELPAGSRVSSLTRLDGNRWILIDRKGNLILSQKGESLSKIEGNFGATADLLQPLRSNWRRTNKQEPVRIAPERIDGKKLLVVMENPPVQTGLQGFFSQGNSPSTIKFFSFENSELTEQSLLGPFQGRVLDLEVSPANPDQFLWTRRTPEGRILLEMLDLSKL